MKIDGPKNVNIYGNDIMLNMLHVARQLVTCALNVDVQTAMDGIRSDVDLFHHTFVSHSNKKVLDALKQHNVSRETLSAVMSVIKNSESRHLFEGLETEYRQTSYFKKEFGLIVSAPQYLYS